MEMIAGDAFSAIFFSICLIVASTASFVAAMEDDSREDDIFSPCFKNKAKVLFSQDQAKASGGLAPYGKLTFVDLRPPRLEKEVFCSFCNRLFRKLRRIIYRHGR